MANNTIVYIDGFNLYYGLKECHDINNWPNYRWLNLTKFAEKIIPQGYDLIETKYFTSRIIQPKDAVKRQTTFIEALDTLSNLKIYEGNFIDVQQHCHYCRKLLVCNECRSIHHKRSEKKTDVNIATQLLVDAYENKFDCAVLVSADTDLIPPTQHIVDIFSDKEVITAIPPSKTQSDQWLNIVTSILRINGKHFIDCFLPDELMSKNNYLLKRPKEWE